MKKDEMIERRKFGWVNKIESGYFFSLKIEFVSEIIYVGMFNLVVFLKLW